MSGVALVSGDCSGLGRSLTVELADRGWEVAIGARRVESLAEVAEEIERKGGRALARSFDLRDADSIERFVSEVATRLGAGRWAAFLGGCGGEIVPESWLERAASVAFSPGRVPGLDHLAAA